jgi:hypothetical protein
MKKFIKLVQFVLISMTFSLSFPAHADLIERILANPKIQALIGKPAELTNALKLCDDVRYRNANAVACAEAQQAAMANRLPFEMRTVMSNAKSAQSLRDLCVAAQTTAQRDSYLCAELSKADVAFGATLQNARNANPAPVSNPGNEASN